MPFSPDQMSLPTVKGFVDRLMRSQKRAPSPVSWPPKRAQAQETIAHVLGYPNWHALHEALSVPTQDPALPGQAGSSRQLKSISELPRLSLSSGATATGIEIQAPSQALATPHCSWHRGSGNIVLTGTAYSRDRILRQMFTQIEGEPAVPMLWLRGNLAYQGGESLLPMAFQPHWPTDMFSVIDQALGSWPAVRLVDFLMSMVGDGDGDDDIWVGRARSMLSPLLHALVWLRDHSPGHGLSVRQLRSELLLEKLEMLSRLKALPDLERAGLKNYLLSIPFYRPELIISQQKEQVLDMHGYLQMQFTKILGVAEELASPLSYARQMVLKMDEAAVGQPSMRQNELWPLTGAYIDIWLDRNPGGILVLDGFMPDSPLYVLLARHQREWVDKSHGWLLGVNGQALWPSPALWPDAASHFAMRIELDPARS